MNSKVLNYILLIHLFIQPFLDVIATTDMNYINIVIRGLFLIFMFIYLLVNKCNRKWVIFLLFSGLIIMIYNFINNESIYNILSSTMKLFYLPITLVFFYNVKNNINCKYMLITLSIYIILFLSSYVFNFGYDNYLDVDGKSGFRGIFNSLNEISAIIIGLLPISLNYLKENNKIIKSIVLIISILMIALLTGTKVLMVGLIIIMLYTYRKELQKVYNKNKILSIIVTLIIFVVGIFLLTKTRFYQNMVIQNSFFKPDNILDFINRVIFNDRLTFLMDNFNYFINQDIIKYIFGIGYFNPFKLVEIDIFDILFRYGILGFTIFVLSVIIALTKSKLKNVYLFNVIFLLLISLTSGHVLLSPNVCIYFGYLLISGGRNE